MDSLIRTIDKLSADLKSLLPMKSDDQQRLDKKIRMEFNYNSNHIEGNTLTYGETVLLLIFGKTTGNHEIREYDEMKAHDVAFELIKEWSVDKERPITEFALKSLHQILLVQPFWKEAITPDGQPTRRLIKVGDYKEYPNSVRLQTGEIFNYASPEETPMLMGDLIQWYREEEEKGELHPVELAALLHYKFVRIHPFDDGNGRISRLLMNYVLLKHDLPPVIINTADKRNYLFALNQADAGNLEAFINYIAEQLIWSLELSINAAKGNRIDEPEDLDKKIFLLKKKLGEAPDVKVELKYSNEAIRKVVNESLLPLTHAWEEKLKSFEPLFLTRRVNILFEDRGFSANGFNNVFDEQCKNHLREDLVKALKNRKIIVKCSFSGLRRINNNVSANGGEVYVTFFENAYELSSVAKSKVVNKLYNQPLTEEEINTIVLDLGNWLYDIIEKLIESKS